MKEFLKYIVAIILIIMFVVSVVPKTLQNDTFYIVTLGEQIVNSGLDRIDHYSWHKNLEYRYPHWLFDIIVGGIFANFNWVGVYGFVCVMSVIAMLVLYGAMLKKGCNWFLSFIAVLGISYIISGSFTARGQIISITLWLIELMLIENFLENKSKLSVIGIFICSCIVANVHATAWIFTLILFLPCIGEALIEWYTIVSVNQRQKSRYEKKLARAKKKGVSEEKISLYEQNIKHCEEFEKTYKPREDVKILIDKKENAKWIFIPIIFAILGAIVTPLGIIPFSYFLQTSLGSSLSFINEHLPVVPAACIDFFIFTVIVIAVLGFTKSKMVLRDALLLLGLFIMALSARRNIFLLIMLCSPIVVKMIDDFINEHTNYRKGFENDGQKLANIVLIIIFIVIFGICIFNFIVRKDEQYIDKDFYPVEATKFIKSNLDYKNIKLFNEYDYGSYLLMEGIPVFVDSRCDLYTSPFNKGTKILDDTIDIYDGKVHYAEIFEKYGVTHAIIKKESVAYTYMAVDEKCEKLYEDDIFVIYQYHGDYIGAEITE